MDLCEPVKQVKSHQLMSRLPAEFRHRGRIEAYLSRRLHWSVVFPGFGGSLGEGLIYRLITLSRRGTHTSRP